MNADLVKGGTVLRVDSEAHYGHSGNRNSAAHDKLDESKDDHVKSMIDDIERFALDALS